MEKIEYDGHIILYEGKNKWRNLLTFKEVDEYVTQMKEGCPVCGSQQLSLLITPIPGIATAAEITCLNGCDTNTDITNSNERKCKFIKDITNYDSW